MMQPPGPPRPFRGAQYDKDMFTFLPSNRDVLPEPSRKRKLTSFDYHTNVPSNGSDSQVKRTSRFSGYSEVLVNPREFNEYGNREPNSRGVAQKRPNCPPPVTQDISHSENYDSIGQVANPKPLDWQPPVNQGSYLHENRESNHKSNGPPPTTQDVNQESNSGAIASTTTTQYYNLTNVGSREIASNLFERASSILSELQRVNVLNPRVLSGVLDEKGRLEEETHNVDGNKIPETNTGISLHNLQAETSNLLNVLRLLSGASGIAIPENNDGKTQDSQGESTLSKKNEDGQCPENIKKGSVKVDGVSKLDDEKLWSGTLKLSTSVSVSAIAFFISGEKVQDLSWSDIVEVKGKVRLEAFEKYVQDLPRSRSRGLMVTSLCWKEGSLDAGHRGMKEVAKKYKDQRKVGFAKLSTDVDLYICPNSEAIITIITKNGFCKEMTYVEDENVPLIGCAVWKKNSSSRSKHTEVPTSEKEETSIGGVEINNKKEKNPEFLPSPRDYQPGKSPVSQNGSTSEFKTDVEINKAVLSIPIVTSKTSRDDDHDDNNDDDDLPEYDFKAAISQASVNKTSKIATPIPNSEGQIPKILERKSEVTIPNLPVQENKLVEKGVENLKKRNLFDDDDDDMPEWCPPDFGRKAEEVTKRVESSNPLNHSNVSTTGFADLASGVMLPPPPPPPPLTKFQLQGQNLLSAPSVHPPPIPVTHTQMEQNSNPFVHLSKPPAIGFKPETTSMSTQLPFNEGNYPFAPPVPPPPFAPRAPPLPTASNVVHKSHVSISPQMEFKEKNYDSAPSVPLPQVEANKLMHQSSAPQSTQMHSEGIICSLAPRPPASKSSNNGLNNKYSAFRPRFTPNPAFRPCFDPPGTKNPIRPSTWRRKP